MKCRVCDSSNTRVTSTDRRTKNVTFRYCRCLDCKAHYKTVEKYVVPKPGPNKGISRQGKIARGSQHGASIFTERDILTMRRMYESKQHTMAEIAKHYGISTSYTSRIINRKFWTHV